MPGEIPIVMPVGPGMAFHQTQAASAVGFGYRSKPGNTVCMAVASSVIQGDYLQDFSRVSDKAFAVHPWMIKMRSWLGSCNLEDPPWFPTHVAKPCTVGQSEIIDS